MSYGTEQVGNPRVRGACPVGCGETLFLGNNGYVTCSYQLCPDPLMAHKLMQKFPQVSKLALAAKEAVDA